MNREEAQEILALRKSWHNDLNHFLDQKEKISVLAIEGERGSGKFTFASLLAAAYLNGSQTTVELLANNNNWQFLSTSTHPDFTSIPAFEEDRKVKVKIDFLREQLDRETKLPPQFSLVKIILIDLDCLTEQSQNVLLKILEEAPPYLKFILTYSNAENILETVLSRTIIYHLKPLSFAEQVSFCRQYFPANKEKKEISEQNFAQILALARGNIGTIIEYLNNNDFFSDRDAVLDILLTLHTRTGADIFLMLDNIVKNINKNNFFFFSIIEFWLKDGFFIYTVLNHKSQSDLMLYENKIVMNDKLEEFSQQIKMTGDFFAHSYNLLQKLEEIRKNFEYNVNFELSLQYFFLLLKKTMDESLI